MSNAATRPVEFLLIEDDPDDVWETQQTLNEAKVTNNLHVAVDGERERFRTFG